MKAPHSARIPSSRSSGRLKTNSPRYYTASASLFRKKSPLPQLGWEATARIPGRPILPSRASPRSLVSIPLSRITIPDPRRSPSGVLRESRSAHPPAGPPCPPAPAQIQRAPSSSREPLVRCPVCHLPEEPSTATRILIFPAQFRRPRLPPMAHGVSPDSEIPRSPQPAQCPPALCPLRCPSGALSPMPARSFPCSPPCRMVTLSRSPPGP